MENITHSFRDTNLAFSSYKNHKLKVKLWWVRARKKKAFFVSFILSEGKFFTIYVLSQCVVYWINFQNIHSFTYQKILFHTLLLLVFKIVKNLQCILKLTQFPCRSIFQSFLLIYEKRNESAAIINLPNLIHFQCFLIGLYSRKFINNLVIYSQKTVNFQTFKPTLQVILQVIDLRCHGKISLRIRFSCLTSFS